MGSPKAAIWFRGESLAGRTARLLESATHPVIEVGPGFTNLPAVRDPEPRQGPLAALVAGVEYLEAGGWDGAVVVVATDMPFLSPELVGWLAGHPGDRSVIPTDCGRPQVLCARYSRGDLEMAAGLARTGKRAMRDLLEAIDPVYAGPEEWMPVTGESRALTDVDTPAQLEAARAALAIRTDPVNPSGVQG
jgi:molybdopterin-guanine dinucleotide biosynthesis protein A